MHSLRKEKIKKKRKTAPSAFTDAYFLNAYLQRLRAHREPGQNINVDAGDGSAPPLGALAHGGARVVRLRRCGARTLAEERQQRARYHLHCWLDGWPRDQDLRQVCLRSAPVGAQKYL